MNLLEIADVLKEHVANKYPDVAIIAIYGSFASDTYNEFSDLDMYAIVDDKTTSNFTISFIFQDIPVEFWTIDWFWAERMAMGKMKQHPWSVSASILTNNKIIYTRSEADKIRFRKLAEKTQLTEFERIEQALTLFKNLYSELKIIEMAKEREDALTARWAAWSIINNIVNILGLINNRCFTKNWGSNLQQLFQLPVLPENCRDLIDILATWDDYNELLKASDKIISDLRKILIKSQKQVTLDIEELRKNLSFDYMGIKEYLNKILSGCKKRDIFLVSYATTEIQLYIADILEKLKKKEYVNSYYFNRYDEVNEAYNLLRLPDLTESIIHGNFTRIENDVKKINQFLETYFKEHNAEIRKFETINDLKLFLNK